jgi:hypothetical protein
MNRNDLNNKRMKYKARTTYIPAPLIKVDRKNLMIRINSHKN